MNIAFIRHSIRNRGADRLVFEYIRYLLGQGHQVVYYINDQNSLLTVPAGCRMEQIPQPGIMGTMTFLFNTRFSHEIVIVDLMLNACLAHHRNAGRVLCLAQDNDITYFQDPIRRWAFVLFYRLGLACWRIPTITVSDALREELLALGACPQKIIAVNNGADHTIFYPLPKNQDDRASSARTTIVLYLRDDYRKGTDIGILALQSLHSFCPQDSFDVWTIGDSKKWKDKLPKEARHLGVLDEPRLRDVLSRADIFLCPSRHEGFGLLPLQAMACGCAVVSTSAVPFLRKDKDALIVNINDHQGLALAAASLIKDAGRLFEYKNAALKRARDLDLVHSRKAFEQALIALTVK